MQLAFSRLFAEFILLKDKDLLRDKGSTDVDCWLAIR
jgi:hypothetical protein